MICCIRLYPFWIMVLSVLLIIWGMIVRLSKLRGYLMERGQKKSPKTKDFMMVLSYNENDTAIIYGVAKPADFVAIATKIQAKLDEAK